jgi:thiamine biosynthesis protein ThiS
MSDPNSKLETRNSKLVTGVLQLTVVVNGEETHIAEGTSVDRVVGDLGLKPERVAVELNHRIVRRSQWTSTALREGDRVEIVHFVGGGAASSRLRRGRVAPLICQLSEE